MIGDFEVVEYTNPYFPDKVMYKILINNKEFHLYYLEIHYKKF